MTSEPTPALPSSRHRRFSIATFLLIIAATAIALAALCRPSWLAANAIFSILLLSLTVAWIGMRHRTGRKRAFCAGYLAAGSLYAILSMTSWFGQEVGSHLITTAILDLAYPFIPPIPKTPNAGTLWEQWTANPPDYDLTHMRNGIFLKTTNSFLLIGHSIFALLAATGGGLLARRYHESEQ